MLDRDLGRIIQGQSDTDGVLISTRAEVVLDPVRLSEGDEILPESFQRGLYPHWGRLIRRGSSEAFLLTERPFNQIIDNFFYLLPSKLIEFYIKRSEADQVRILDAGGGRDGAAARDVARRYPNAQVINVDFVAVNESTGNFASKQGDLCNLDLPDESIDFAYSHQVLPYMNRDDNYARHTKVIEEAYRVLRPGGAAVIDFTNEAAIPVNVLRSIDERLNAFVLPKRKSYGGGFLLIIKNPIDPGIMSIGDRAQKLVA